MKIDIKEISRRPQVWGSIVSIAVMAIISLAFFYPDSTAGNTLQQHDMIQGMANGEEARAFHEATGETTRWTNSLFGGMPTFQIAPSYPSDSLFGWIGKVYSLGLPAESGLMMMMMMGMYWLLMTLRRRWYYSLIGAVAWAFSSYFVIIIGAGHLWKFITLAYVPPTIAGIVLAYRGRYVAGGAVTALALMMQIASNHLQMTYYFGFVIILLVVAYLIKALIDRKAAGWLRGSASLLVAAALAVAANSPNLYNTYRYSAETIRGGHSELTRPGGSATADGLDLDYITQYSYGKGETFTLFIPNVKGGASARPDHGRMVAANISDIKGADEALRKSGLQDYEIQYIQQFVPQYFGEPEGTNGPVYVGVIIFALFLVGCIVVKGPLKWALLAATVLSIALAWGRNFMSLTELFIDIVPLYNKFRTPESILVIAEFTMPVLAVMALQKILTDVARARFYRRVTACVFGTVVLFCFLGWVSPGIYGNAISKGDLQVAEMIGESLSQQGYGDDVVSAYSIANPRIAAAVTELRLSMVRSDSLRSLLFLILSGVAVIVSLSLRNRRAANIMAATSLGLLVFIDLSTVDKRYVSHDSFTTAPPAEAKIPMSAADRAILADTSYYRVMPMGGLFQSATPSYYHKSLGGYHAAKLTRYQDMIERHLLPAASGHFTDAGLNVINMLNGKYIIDPEGRVLPNPDALGNAWLVDTLTLVDGADAEMAALDSIDPATAAVADRRFAASLPAKAQPLAPGDTIMLVKYAPNELTYRYNTAGGALAVFSEVYFPWGWTARLDNGTELPVARVDYLLRAVDLPAGSGTLTMTFDPRSLKVTGAVATVAIVLIYLWVIAVVVTAVRRKNG